MEIREIIRQEFKDAGWLVTSKDAIKFGADFLLYTPPDSVSEKTVSVHSVSAVVIIDEAELTFLEAQRFSRICEVVRKRAIFAVCGKDGIRYVQVDRWIPHIS